MYERKVGVVEVVFDCGPAGAGKVVEVALYGNSGRGSYVEDGVNDVVVGYWRENGCFAVVVEVGENEVEDVTVTLCGVLYSLD